MALREQEAEWSEEKQVNKRAGQKINNNDEWYRYIQKKNKNKKSVQDRKIRQVEETSVAGRFQSLKILCRVSHF